MVAMAILAIALVSIFQLQSQSISMATDSRFIPRRLCLPRANGRDETVLLCPINSNDGDFGLDYPQYTWHVK